MFSNLVFNKFIRFFGNGLLVTTRQKCLKTVINNRKCTTKPSIKENVILTDSCVKQLNKIADNKSYLRVQIDSGGCSGFQYKFTLETAINEDDKIFEKDGAKVVIDKESLEFIKGSSIDYHHELIRSAFHVVNNPQAENGCSCGASFNVKI
ncbi:hypothetical protein HELRODRAFT_175503 [Helobdella robusta]|uniref:Iron-sulfur cluster assembly 2 homolog, mitochondrial n=1 Tax=Helobdella robusta TaxID=6412 RepID=T1F9C1_HELRO|nr:hypothetical protein HELRODRAFT_175503 [Helobdella robusta]ESO00543.1 hypothetical protein HELRODRAFT_175503 [Helobdella robusta]